MLKQLMPVGSFRDSDDAFLPANLRNTAMPHCVIECSSTLGKLIDLNHLVLDIHRIINCSGMFNVGATKVRVITSENFFGQGDCSDYVHVRTHILSGRPIELQKKLSDLIVLRICELLPSINCISSEIIEINNLTHSNKVKALQSQLQC